jgi:cytochrome P450
MDFDFFDPPAVSALGPHEAWNRMRTDAGLFWTPRNEGHWVLTRGTYIKEALADHAHFSSANVVLPIEGKPIPIIPQELDPPRHHDYRKIVNLALGPKVVAGMETKARHCARIMAEKIAGRGECEFMRDFARLLPMRLFLDLVELPAQDGAMLSELTRIAGGTSPLVAKQEAFRELMDYVQGWIDERQRHPGTDLFSRIAHAHVEGGRRMSREEMLGFATQSLFGGLDTVAAVLGFSMNYLAGHPVQRSQLAEQPTRLRGAVEELLRRFGIAVTGRVMVCDHEFHGVGLRKGEYVQLPTFMHGLDADEFAAPMTVDFERVDASTGCTFGQGIHRCPGSSLGRLELRVALEEWLARIPEFQIKEGTRMISSSGPTLGVHSLPLQWSNQ